MRWTLLKQLTVTSFLLVLSNFRCGYCLRCYTGVARKSDDAIVSANRTTSVQCPRKLTNFQRPIDFQSPEVIGDYEDYENSDGSPSNCIIFYDAHLDKAEFACDTNNVCNGALERKLTSVCYNGVRGALYCCQGDQCNSESFLKRMSPPQAATICYSGTNNGTIDIGEVNCKSSWCYQSSTFLPNGHVFEQNFGCDVLCDDSDLELTSDTCREYVSHTGLRRRTCYCSSDRCNSMIRQLTLDEINAEPPFPATDAPAVQHQSMSNPEFSLERMMQKRWFVMTTCVMGGLSCLVFIMLMTLAVIRCQQNRAKKLSISYVRLDDDKIAVDPERCQCSEKVMMKN